MRKVYSSAVWRIPTSEKKIFLTFDDGPVPEITPWVLSELKKYNAKATFFCVGANIERYPDILHQVIVNGHSIGNHTYDHLNGWKTKKKNYFENISRCNDAIQKIQNPGSGMRNLFRPPYGRIKRSQISALRPHYTLVMWDVLSGDFDAGTSEEECLKNVLTKTREGSIVVFHDSSKAKRNLFYTLPRFLEYFSGNGFRFECLMSAKMI